MAVSINLNAELIATKTPNKAISLVFIIGPCDSMSNTSRHNPSKRVIMAGISPARNVPKPDGLEIAGRKNG
jgi:hypothetical protein